MSIAGWNRAQALMDADIRDFVFWSRVDTGSKKDVVHVNSSSEIVIENALEANALDLTIEIEPKQTGIGTPSAPVLYESSNGTLTFTAKKNQNASSAVFGMEPKQSGSGDASPTNVRSLAAYDELKYLDNTTGTSPSSCVVIDVDSLVGTEIYGGTYDAVSGVLTKTHDVVDLSSSNWEYVKTFANTNTFNVAISGLAEIGDGLCDCYKYEKVSLVALQPDKTFFFYKHNNSEMRISVRDDDYSNAVDFKASLSGGMNVCYPLAIPVTYNGTPAVEIIVSGTNRFSNLTGSYVGVADAGNIRPIVNHTSTKLYHNVYRYGVRWNRVDAACTERLWDAAGITRTVTHFCHRGTIDSDYENPFDEIYPFNQFKMCEVDLDLYRGLSSGDDIRDAVSVWAGDSGFSWGVNDFVGAYRPEYWVTAYDDENGDMIIGVSNGNIDGWMHVKPYIRGSGYATDGGKNSQDKNVLKCGSGEPYTSISFIDLHEYANNGGFTIEDIYTYSAELTAAVVEYASMNLQNALGRGCEDLYSDDKITSKTSDTKFSISTNLDKYAYNASFSITSSSSSAIPGSSERVMVTNANVGNTTTMITFSPSKTFSVGYYARLRGCLNISGFRIRASSSRLYSNSGYFGPNGKTNVFYRGSVMYGNRYRYVLGIYKEKSSPYRYWLCPEESCDSTDDINTGTQINTNIEGATTSTYISNISTYPNLGLIPFVTSTSSGATSNSPVGDIYTNATSGNFCRLLSGGSASSTANGGIGPFRSYWRGSTDSSNAWNYAVVPILKSK